MVEKIKIFSLIGIIEIIGNWVGFRVNPIEAIPGMAIIIVITIIGMAITSALPIKIPAVVWVSLIALIVTTPILPGNGWIVDQTSKINFMALAIPILAYAGLSLGKDLDSLKKVRLAYHHRFVSRIYRNILIRCNLFRNQV